MVSMKLKRWRTIGAAVALIGVTGCVAPGHYYGGHQGRYYGGHGGYYSGHHYNNYPRYYSRHSYYRHGGWGERGGHG